MENALVGRWTLIEFKRRFADSGDVLDLMGANPRGVLSVSPDGYITVLITNAHRTVNDTPADLFAGLMAYSGSCTIESDRFTTHVDNAWHPSWIGTDQLRFFRIDGDVLQISTAEQSHPAFPGRLGRGILTWRRS